MIPLQIPLKELVVSDGVLVPDFDSEGTNYTVTLDGDLALLSTVTVIGFKNHNAATVIGNGEYNLNDSGSTVVTIKVVAQSGDERDYKITSETRQIILDFLHNENYIGYNATVTAVD